MNRRASPLSSRSHRPQWVGPPLFAALVLLLGLCLSYGAWRAASDASEQQLRADFDFRVRELVGSITGRMRTYTDLLNGVQGLYASSTDVTRDEFHSYLSVRDLARHYPGILGIGYLPLLPASQRAAHEARARAQGLPGYAIKSPGARPLLAPITYLEPLNASNLRAMGHDLLAEPVRRAALEQARDTGQAAMTAKLKLLQDNGASDTVYGFLLVMPIFDNALAHDSVQQRRAALRAWVFAPFRMQDLMRGVGGEASRLLDLEIYDGEQLDAGTQLYDSLPAAQPAPARLSATRAVTIAGHVWTVRVRALPAFDGELLARPRVVGWTGLCVSLALALATWLLAVSRYQAQRSLARANEMAGQLEQGQASVLAMAEAAQRSQAMLRNILDSTLDGILVDNRDGHIFTSNRRFRDLWQVPDTLDWQADGAALALHVQSRLEQATPFLDALRHAPHGHREQRDLLHLRDGRVIEQYIRSMQLGNEQARLWTFRDISERSLAERRETTRRQVLEMLAIGAPLERVLESVVLGVQADHHAMLCSILLLDEGRHRLVLGAAPSLPAFFNLSSHGHGLDMLRGVHGVAALAVRSGQRISVPDLRAAETLPGEMELAGQAGLQSCWAEPVRGGSGKLLGVLMAYHRQPLAPGASHLARLSEAAHLAGMAIEQAQVAQALRAGEARFRSLYDHAPVALWEQDWSAVRAALDLLDQPDLPAYFQRRPDELKRLAGLVRILDANGAALAQVRANLDDQRRGRLGLAQNFDDAALPAFGAALLALAGGAHVYECESSFQRLDGAARQNELSLLVMPGHADSLNFVMVSSLDITERKRMNAELLQLATTDFLTGLPNRRQFMTALANEHARLQRELASVATVLMLDIDHFKRVNDEHGHAVGDVVLRHLGALMCQALRKVDVSGRMGGEEFAILLPGTGMASAAVFAERLRARVADSSVGIDGGALLSVTVSIGMAAMSGTDAGCDAVLARADEALYRAKRSGRNRVEHHDGGNGGVLSQFMAS
ncbi:CHASE domain-containing protein [Janthinobacterium psychrotolerans]|uniref:diguanylate cyclase n=1 Tax=Janthinobacterium psychrotolerans TaxID=1747903 RepID=A0A1A7BY24_9BURK|nr:CHASE domain-containing protein [Janthinobacterium psychrotolerans]OBV37018.1 diguanylate cyclase (GGDEF) domain-containing protein [Janthinobacterium psychrotolerans]